MFVQLNEENRIVGVSDENCFPSDTKVIEFDFPEDFDINTHYEYLIIDGKLVGSESPETKQYREESEQVKQNSIFLSEAPDIIAEQDDAICALYEENLSLKSTADDVDEAICYLYEQLTEVNADG